MVLHPSGDFLTSFTAFSPKRESPAPAGNQGNPIPEGRETPAVPGEGNRPCLSLSGKRQRRVLDVLSGVICPL